MNFLLIVVACIVTTVFAGAVVSHVKDSSGVLYVLIAISNYIVFRVACVRNRKIITARFALLIAINALLSVVLLSF